MSNVASAITDALHRIRPTTRARSDCEHSCSTSVSNTSAVDWPNLRSGLIPLDNILARAGRSHSWAYENHIVPIYDDQGQHINSDACPPHPWEQLPAPRIKTGQKLWWSEDVEAWFQRFEARTNESAEAPVSTIGARRRVTA